jgi:predicted negative regulator of RcsB-dependent stress response
VLASGAGGDSQGATTTGNMKNLLIAALVLGLLGTLGYVVYSQNQKDDEESTHELIQQAIAGLDKSHQDQIQQAISQAKVINGMTKSQVMDALGSHFRTIDGPQIDSTLRADGVVEQWWYDAPTIQIISFNSDGLTI